MRKILLLLSVFFSVLAYSQGHETFDNFDRTGTSYGMGTFDGQDGSTWTYSECRGDLDLNGKAITLGRNRPNPIFVESGTITGGMGTLEFSYVQAFSSNVNLNVVVNGDIVHTVTTDGEQDVIKNSGPITIDVEGDIVLRFEKNNSSGQVTIDDIIWTAHGTNSEPDDCSQSTASNDIEDGYGHLHLVLIASDFVVDQGEAFTLEQVKMNVIVEAGLDVLNANLTFYEPSSEGPGALITSQNSIAPSAQTTVDDLGTFEVKEVTFDLPTPLTFEATNSSDKVYWMGVNIGYNGASSYLEVSSLFNTPNEAYSSTDDGQTWDSTIDLYGDNLHGVIEFSGVCEELDDDPTPPGGSCEWTVIVQDDYFGDEVEWELRTMDGTVLLFGGFYPDEGYYDEQSITAEGPLEFWITNDGFFGDNTPDYSVSNGTQILVSGTLPESETLTFSDLNCEGGDDPTPPGDCFLSYEGENEDGLGDISTGIILAADFPVGANEEIDLESIKVQILNDLTSIEVSLYEDNGGQPGTEIFAPTSIVPASQTLIGTNSLGTPIYEYDLDFSPYDITLSGGASGALFWVAITATGDDNYWSFSTQIHNGTNLFGSLDDYGTWEDLSDYGFIEDGAFSINCEGLDPVDPVCMFNISSSVEPITRVVIANVDNSSSATSTEALEDFTDIEIIMAAGQPYEVALEGNTDGPFDNYFTLFVDTSGDWSDYLMYEIGSIEGSDGTDGQQAVSTITIPADTAEGTYTVRIVKNFGSSPTNPCSVYSYGQAEDYSLTVELADDCNGTPDAGITNVSPATGNVGTTYSVTNSEHDFGGGMSYQWQSNTDGAGWVDEGDATANYSSYTATAPDQIDIEVEWRLAVTCTLSNETSYSDSATFTSVFEYCTPGGSDTWAWINDFSTTGGVSNISNMNSGFSSGGYGDFFDTHAVEQVIGGEISFEIAFDPETCGARIWIDWNQDGTFSEDEVVWNSDSYAMSHTGTITVPATALEGETRMRVVNHWLDSEGDVDPCSTNHGYGEFEDYKFIVSAVSDCDGTPDAGTASVTPAVAAPGATYTVSSSGYSIADGLSFQWESNTDGAGWVEEGTATDSYENYTATAPDEMDIEVEWRLKVTCGPSGESAYSTTATFVTGIQYCEPDSNCTDGDNIVNVTFREIDNTTDCSPNGYGDYTHLSATVAAGETYDIYVAVGDGWFERVSLWIDWNQDGVFDASEYMGEIGEGGQGDVLEDTVTIPADAAEGTYRMRFVLGAVGSDNPAPEDPCDTPTYGETEDYTLIVDDAAGINNINHTGFTFYPNPAETTLYLKSDVKIESVSGYNILGQKVISNNQFNNGQVDVSNLSTGAYLFEVTFENGTTETFRVLRK